MKKCNKEKVQPKKNATRKKVLSMKKVQHGNNAT